MSLSRLLGFLILITLLTGCPAKMKILYLKFSVGKEIEASDFLEKIGRDIQAPLADEKVGLNVLKNQCQHRRYKSKEENTLLGACILNKSIYIYALVPDHGDDPKNYFGNPALAETMSRIERYKNNTESSLKTANIWHQFEGQYVIQKTQFIRLLEEYVE